MTALYSLLLAAGVSAAPPAASPYFTIRVVDEATVRGVPMVELRTTGSVRLWTDSAGVAAFNEPGLMGRSVWFAVESPGYEFAKDGFGLRGKTLVTTPGATATLKIRRVNLAERLYRVTGGGIYRDSVLTGREVPIREPLLNGDVLGSDSVVNVVYRGKLYWVWGDTNRPSYPLGNFSVTGATSLLPGKGGLAPGVGVDLRYFLGEDGFARQMAPMPGKGPTWITSLVVLPDGEKRDRLLASYIKVEPPMKVYARGLAVFNDTKGVFEHLCDFDFAAPCYPNGHAFLHRDNGVDYVYFASPYPLTRVRARLDDFRRPERYECYTCLKDSTRLDRAEIDRDASGKVVYRWRKNTPAVGPFEQGKLVAQGKLKRAEGLLQLRDRDTGKAVVAHAGSVYWNAYRKRWVMIFVEWGGTSFLGEEWYAEAPAPTGPWAYAVKVATHPRYSFYNPKQHPYFDEHGGRVIYFEGTYSHTFSGNHEQTPRYDYNQLMYRLDLADSRLALPAAVGEKKEYFALDRPVKGMVSVFAEAGGKLRVGEVLKKDEAAPGAAFYALPADAKETPPTMVLRQDGKPLCRVWRSPWAGE
jgi:hypothetical protein